MELARMNADDIDGVFVLEQLVYKNPWTKQNFIDELKNEYSRMYVLKENNIILGYIGAWVVIDEADITKVTVLPELQNKGLGKYLLSFLINSLIKENVRQINLEVRKSNAGAIHLYEKFGFKQIAVRKKYYSDGEDALIYVLVLDGGKKSEKVYIGN